MTKDEKIARAFKALAHPRRARLFRLLAERPEIGDSMQNLQMASGLRETPLRHHLLEMEKGGLLARRRRGNHMAHILTPGFLTLAMQETARISQGTRNRG